MATFHRVASVADFQDGLVRVFPVDGIEIAVVRHEGVWHGFSGRCPHANYLLNFTRVKPEDRILCSSHMALFDLHTGCVISGPTDEGLKRYPVQVAGDDVMVSNEPE
jgi:nitrite reductase/ring-hydroxylating ferredoxin subunit